jgi:hypothetical protein
MHTGRPYLASESRSWRERDEERAEMRGVESVCGGGAVPVMVPVMDLMVAVMVAVTVMVADSSFLELHAMLEWRSES